MSCADLQTMTDFWAQVLGLGATRVRENNDADDAYVVMRDPEGNEFCVCSLPPI